MFTTGEFAAMTGLSAKALRLYDDKDVLSPAAVDPDTGYRSYASSQLRRAQVLGFLRQTSFGLDDLRTDPVDVEGLRDRLAYVRRMEDFALDVAERLHCSTPEVLEATTRTAPTTPWVGLTRTIDLLDARDGADTLLGQASTFEDAAAELAARYSPATPDQDLWWTTTRSAPTAQSVVVLVARPSTPSSPIGEEPGQRPLRESHIMGLLPKREEVSFSSISSDTETDPVAEAAAGFIEVLAFDAYRTARGIGEQPMTSRRVTYGPTHPLGRGAGRVETVFDLSADRPVPQSDAGRVGPAARSRRQT